jgi:adenine/guanine phosphoribosyltransferase-like PRPP-binding protein
MGTKFNSAQYSPLSLNLSVRESASINADNIGEFALPLVEYIHQTKPDYVVASDGGARLLGLAVFRLHNQLYGRFPTADGTIRFRRFSKSNTQQDTEKHLQPLVTEMLAHKKRPTVLVLDDWVWSGGTKRLATDIFDKLGKGRIRTKFGVLIGEGADVSGHKSQTSGFAGITDWRDDSNIIGVRYGHNNYGSSGIKAQAVRSDESRDYRRRMYEGIERLAERINQGEKEVILTKAQ